MMQRPVQMFAVAILTAATAFAAKPLKLGTVAPRDSSFHKILLETGNATREHVELKIYPGGILGGEAEMVRRMKAGSLDAALLTAVGLSEIDRSVHALQSMPLMFASLDEVDSIGQRLQPRLDGRLREKGFVVLFWADAGWVRFFSRDPVIRPADLQKTKLFTWAGDTQAANIYRAAGFNPVPLETNDIASGLQTGLINAVPLPPYVALATQVYTKVPHMLELNWAPLVGALVVTERAWNRLTPEARTALTREAASAGKRMKAQNRAESDAAIAAMIRRGLVVHRVSPAAAAEWSAAVEAAYPRIRGGIVPADVFDEVRMALKERRP
jgi:TRAP-type C4-dicarboxylate transport system substrate-binding protein